VVKLGSFGVELQNWETCHFMYLDLTIWGDFRRLQFSCPLLGRIKEWLLGWTTCYLSMEDRLVLLKFALSSLSLYFLFFCKVSTCIISSIESIFIFIFLCGRKLGKYLGLNEKLFA